MKELRDHIKTEPSYHHPGPPYTYQEPKFNHYAHMLIVVAFLVVNFFGVLVITRNHTMRFGPKLEEIFL